MCFRMDKSVQVFHLLHLPIFARDKHYFSCQGVHIRCGFTKALKNNVAVKVDVLAFSQIN